jgi:hypothetical protein
MYDTDNNTQQVYSREDIDSMKERYNRELIIDGKGKTEQVPMPPETVISKPPHVFGLTTFSEYINEAAKMAEFRIKESLWKDEVKIDIQTPYEWFAIQPWGDFHIGSHGCDYERLRELLAGPLQYDNLKTILIGDMGDFFTPKGSPVDGLMGDVLTPQTQIIALKKFLTEYQDSILATTNDPSHTDWVYQSSGIDVYEFIARELNVPLVSQGGKVLIDFGGVSYDIMPFHNIAKFKSAFNLTHGHKQALRLHRDCDAVLSGHIHKPDYEWAFHNGHEVSLVQSGTLETKETANMYGRKQGFLGSVESVYPIILFNTREKRMQIVTSLENAEPYLQIK